MEKILTGNSLIVLLIITGVQFVRAQKLYTEVSNITSSNLPLIFIDTNDREILDTPKIKAKLGIIWNGANERNYITDPLNDYDGEIMIEIRGATSQGFPKKQYAFETVDSLGENNNVSLLGMPEENDWILYAPYSDKSLMRNVLEYKLARSLGWYASRTMFCEIILNDEYIGVYVLLEKIKRDKNRVDIAKLRTEDISGDELTGGYIVKIDKYNGDDTGGWRSDYPKNSGLSDKLFYQYHYPKTSDITNEQKIYIKNFLNDFEAVLESDTYSDSLNGYEKYIDVPSFIDFLILNEIGKNVDAYSLSTFMHKEKINKGGKLKMGPVWDFNIAFGNVDFNNAELIEGWRLFMPFKDIPFWWKRFISDERFTSKLYERWTFLRENELSDEKVLSIIDSVSSLLDEAQERNFQKWNILGKYIWPNYYVGNSYNDEVDYLKSWIIERVSWMDENINFDYSGQVIEDQGEYALSFDGVDDYVDCGSDSSLAITGQKITLEAWVKVRNFKERSYQGAVISRDQMASGADFGYVLRCGGNGYVDFIFGDGSWVELQSPANSISKNIWTHLTATYDGTKMKIYVNGNMIVDKLNGSSINASQSTHLFIGNSPGDMSRGFEGIIDEVRIWNIARKEAQIISTMNITLDGKYYNSQDSGLVGYWRFNEGETSKTKDKTENNNIGFLGALYDDDQSEPTWFISNLVIGVDDQDKTLLNQFNLAQNYPNPFNPETSINFHLPISGHVKLVVFDTIGREVKTVVDEYKSRGKHQVEFDTTDLSSGIYFYRIQSGPFIDTKKFVVMK